MSHSFKERLESENQALTMQALAESAAHCRELAGLIRLLRP